jgi:1-deoxy-D-xylulose-5-phosphate reductoisomerase
MPKDKIKVVVLGSTGTIGVNTLEVIKKSKIHRLVGLSAGDNIVLLMEQIEFFKPKFVCVKNEKDKILLKNKYPNIKFFQGENGLKKIATLDEIDLVVSAIVGFAGFIPTYYALKFNKKVALANKESLVAGGFLFSSENLNNIIPIDSEHSAIHQIIDKKDKNDISKLILTASGGPFLNYTKEEMKNIKKEDALKHPNWSMGDKITIDSSTMINKTLEIIEAHYLFSMPYEKISVIIHPQSLIHSMVEFKDGSIIAQISSPDMKLPISRALYYPDIEYNNYNTLKFSDLINLTFIPPNYNLFPSLLLAQEVIKEPEKGVVLNSANEVAVQSFLNNDINWCEIYKTIRIVLNDFVIPKINDIYELKKIDEQVKKFTLKVIEKIKSFE